MANHSEQGVVSPPLTLSPEILYALTRRGEATEAALAVEREYHAYVKDDLEEDELAEMAADPAYPPPHNINVYVHEGVVTLHIEENLPQLATETLRWLSEQLDHPLVLQLGLTCSQAQQGGFGGIALVFRDGGVLSFSTAEWVAQILGTSYSTVPLEGQWDTIQAHPDGTTVKIDVGGQAASVRVSTSPDGVSVDVWSDDAGEDAPVASVWASKADLSADDDP